MSHAAEIDRYVKAPFQLVELCREVIDHLESGGDNGETSAMEAQLREIAKAIDKLEKQGVPVPEPLRAEKTRLAAALGIEAESTQALNHLADELEELLRDLKSRLGRDVEPSVQKKSKAKRSKVPKTSKAVLRKLIVEALHHLGGAAQKSEVLKYMEHKLQGKLLPGDLEWRKTTNDYAWQNNACWERFMMTQDGVMKTGSPRGMWELTEGQL